MKKLTAYKYRHIFAILTFIGFSMFMYGLQILSPIVTWGAFVLIAINTILISDLPD